MQERRKVKAKLSLLKGEAMLPQKGVARWGRIVIVGNGGVGSCRIYSIIQNALSLCVPLLWSRKAWGRQNHSGISIHAHFHSSFF